MNPESANHPHPPRIQLQRLFISPGHNYFGHHGRPAGRHPLVEVREVACVAGQGLVGDRFFGFKENYGGQVTLFASEVFAEVCRQIGVTGKSPGVTRRNLITAGAELPGLIGRTFEIQGVQFEGVCECSPCHWMNEAIGPGAEAALQGRGGLRARILTAGVLRVDA